MGTVKEFRQRETLPGLPHDLDAERRRVRHRSDGDHAHLRRGRPMTKSAESIVSMYEYRRTQCSLKHQQMSDIEHCYSGGIKVALPELSETEKPASLKVPVSPVARPTIGPRA